MVWPRVLLCLLLGLGSCIPPVCVHGSSSRRSSRQEGPRPTFTRICSRAFRQRDRTSFYRATSGEPDRTVRWSRRSPAAQLAWQRPRYTHWSRHRRVARSVRSGPCDIHRSRHRRVARSVRAWAANRLTHWSRHGPVAQLVRPSFFGSGLSARPGACRRAERRREEPCSLFWKFGPLLRSVRDTAAEVDINTNIRTGWVLPTQTGYQPYSSHRA